VQKVEAGGGEVRGAVIRRKYVFCSSGRCERIVEDGAVQVRSRMSLASLTSLGKSRDGLASLCANMKRETASSILQGGENQ
jgi:hypothetical protein